MFVASITWLRPLAMMLSVQVILLCQGVHVNNFVSIYQLLCVVLCKRL